MLSGTFPWLIADNLSVLAVREPVGVAGVSAED
jgi:hypothetical protein